MEVAEIYYKAKDGKIFTDPLQCEEYEKTIGILDGSVGYLIHTLEKMAKPEYYINGMVMVRRADGTGCMYGRCTRCVDDVLEDYVNVENLSKDKRYITTTVEELIQTLKQEDKDMPCQYMLIWSDNVDMQNYGSLTNWNSAVWPKDEDKK